MIPEKEHLRTLELMLKRETPMYTNSADTGVYVNDSELETVRQSVKALKKFYGGRNWTCNTAKMKQAAVLGIMIPFEVEGDMARGVTVDVNVVESASKKRYTTSPRRYVTITISRFHEQTKDVPALLRDEMDQS